jgi:hypothetical protein
MSLRGLPCMTSSRCHRRLRDALSPDPLSRIEDINIALCLHLKTARGKAFLTVTGSVRSF